LETIKGEAGAISTMDTHLAKTTDTHLARTTDTPGIGEDHGPSVDAKVLARAP
jgi:hypothetical protein